jgi:hypothetical protein
MYVAIIHPASKWGGEWGVCGAWRGGERRFLERLLLPEYMCSRYAVRLSVVGGSPRSRLFKFLGAERDSLELI